MMIAQNASAIKRGRRLYLLEGALEYLISIPVTGSFLAILTRELGISDRLTGILSSVISLGCLFQLLSLSVRRTGVKRMVIRFSLMNQLLFTLLYVIPLIGGKQPLKQGLFVLFIVAAYFVYNLAHPKKISWLMSLVEDGSRGAFTANKEILSLVCGMVFSFLMGAMIDRFAASGRIRTAFILSAAVLLLLTVLHTLTMAWTVEREAPAETTGCFLSGLKAFIHNPKMVKITGVFVLYSIANYASVPFYGTYQIGELRLSLKTVSVLMIGGNLSRILVSRLWGRYADRKSFAAMTEKCLLVLGLAQWFALMAVPSNGAVMFALYYVFYGIAMGGINSALINLVFDYADTDTRSDSLAITQAVSGLVGFLTTVGVSPLLPYVQGNPPVIFGIPVYAQQLCTLISLLFTAAAVLYVRKALLRKGASA